jgi:hypothetical protein
MSVVGNTYKSKADDSRWRVSAYDEAMGKFTLQPEEFGSARSASPDELRRDYSNVRGMTVPDTTDEQSGWNKLGAKFKGRTSTRRTGVDGLLTPEQVFRGEARARAQEIAQDPDSLADYEIGVLPISPIVARELDNILLTFAKTHDVYPDGVTGEQAKRLGLK